MTEPRAKHLKVLKDARWRRNIILVTVAIGSICFGVFLSFSYGLSGDWARALFILVPFALVFPAGLFYLACRSIGRLYAQTENVIRAGEPVSVEVEEYEPISGEVRLRLPEGVGFFRVEDPTVGLIHALRCELKVFDAAQKEKRREIAREYAGKGGTFYSSDLEPVAVLFVNDTAMRLERISQQTALELKEFRNQLRKK